MEIYEIPLEAHPRVNFSFIIGGEHFIVELKLLGKYIYMDLTLNNEVIFKGMLCNSNISLTNNFKYKGILGDLIFVTNKNQNVDFKEFNTDKCKLFYVIR